MPFYSKKFWFGLKCSSIMQITLLLFNSTSHFFRRNKSKWNIFIVSISDYDFFFKYPLTSRAWSPINVTNIQGHYLAIYKIAKNSANQNENSAKLAKTKNDNRKQIKNPTKIKTCSTIFSVLQMSSNSSTFTFLNMLSVTIFCFSFLNFELLHQQSIFFQDQLGLSLQQLPAITGL